MGTRTNRGEVASATRARLAAARLDFTSAHPAEVDVHRATRLPRQYGLTVEQYEDMLIEQNGVCKICRQKCSSGKRLAVDHNHKTGKVRGLLCCACNTGIGSMGDSPARLRAAADYLEKAGR